MTERNYEEVDRWRREHASIDWVLLAQGRLNPSQHPNLAAAQRLCADGIQKITAGQQANECRLGIEEVKTAPHSPWQNPFAERLVGSIRRECLDHVIVLSEAHLLAILKSYFSYYHRARTHLSLGKDAPDPRPVQLPSAHEIVAFPEAGGLHHRYERRAA